MILSSGSAYWLKGNAEFQNLPHRFTEPEIFFKNFIKSVGQSVGQIFPTKEKGVSFYANPLIFLGVTNGI